MSAHLRFFVVQDKEYTHKLLSFEYTSSCPSQSKLVKKNYGLFKILPLEIPVIVTALDIITVL